MIIIVYIILFLILILGLWMLIEPHFLRTVFNRFECRPSGEDLDLAEVKGEQVGAMWFGRPTGVCNGSLRIAFVSDFHGWFNFVSMDMLLKRIADANVDLVLFGGDISTWMLDRRHGLLKLERFCRGCNRLGVFVYMVYGNHDAGMNDSRARRYGLRFMENEYTVIRDHQNRPWCIIGLEDLKAGHPNIKKALGKRHVTGLRPDPVTAKQIPPHRRIVLAHNPDTVELIQPRDAGLILSGHYHGGQIRLPFRLEYKTLRHDKLSREGIYQHHFKKNGIWGYITNGVGCVLLPLRFLAAPELSILDLEDVTTAEQQAEMDHRAELRAAAAQRGSRMLRRRYSGRFNDLSKDTQNAVMASVDLPWGKASRAASAGASTGAFAEVSDEARAGASADASPNTTDPAQETTEAIKQDQN